MKGIIEEKIKKLYDSKASFCESINLDHKNLAQKLRGIENRVNEVNKFLKPLGLQVVIKEIDI